MSLLIRHVQLDGVTTDILIQDGRFQRIRPQPEATAETVLDGSGKAIFPAFINGHTHAAMTLLRGYADDLDLHTWLNDHIWPCEANMTEETVYHGARLACLEMIKSGTVFFNDMYWHFHGTARAVEETGLRAALAGVLIDGFDADRARNGQAEATRLHEEMDRYSSGRIQFALGPHALYTVSEASLHWVRDFAAEHQLQIHLHLSETEKEVADCVRQTGLRPVHWLDEHGLLGPETILAHAVWLEDSEIERLAETRTAVVHCPVSNMKLAAGTFRFARMRRAGVRIALGTDGCASNNNLDLLEEMKTAALLAKGSTGDPTECSAACALELATRSGADIFGLQTGAVHEGLRADCLLVDLHHHRLCPGFNPGSDLVYSANSECIDTVICDGRVLMQNRMVPGEAEIVEAAREHAFRLTGKTRPA